jgi:hypothetical protein
LAAFLEAGGALFLSGSEIGWDLVHYRDDAGFYNETLGAAYAGDDAVTHEAAPAPGGVFEGLPPFRFDAAGEYGADYPDQLLPLGDGQAALTYVGGLGGVAGLQASAGCRRLVYLGFPFEVIDPAARADVMARVMGFLDECVGTELETVIASPADGAARGGLSLRVEGRVLAPAAQRVEVSLQRTADGLFWQGSGWGPPAWLTAEGTYHWRYTLPADLEGGAYQVRARVVTPQGDPDPTPAEAAFVWFRPSLILPLVSRGALAPGCVDLIVDGGFEHGQGWQVLTTSYPATYVANPVHGGFSAVRVGIPAGQSGGHVVTYSSIGQAVSLPADRSVTLRYFVAQTYEDGDRGDLQYVWLRDAAGEAHILATSRQQTSGWRQREIDLTSFAGQTVQLVFSARNDGDAETAASVIDDVQVATCSLGAIP